MKIKLKGKDEFEAFLVVTRVVASNIRGGVSSLPGWCELKSVEKLAWKLIMIKTRQGQFRKSISITVDEAQTALLYRLLPVTPLMQYERLIADGVVEQLEHQFRNGISLEPKF
jgi:hypothetical protein